MVSKDKIRREIQKNTARVVKSLEQFIRDKLAKTSRESFYKSLEEWAKQNKEYKEKKKKIKEENEKLKGGGTKKNRSKKRNRTMKYNS